MSSSPKILSDSRYDVVIAAGGLGTRVSQWSQILPKELLPVDGVPGIIHLIKEASTLNPGTIYVVYHPHYEQLIRWVKDCVNTNSSQYHAFTKTLGKNTTPLLGDSHLQIEFVPETGIYCDLSSLLTVNNLLKTDNFFMFFADNIYIGPSPLSTALKPSQVCVSGKTYSRNLVQNYGVAITELVDGNHLIRDIVEKPTEDEAKKLELLYGPENLFMIAGRFKFNRKFLESIDIDKCKVGAEPKISLAVRNYALINPVQIIVSDSNFFDLGCF